MFFQAKPIIILKKKMNLLIYKNNEIEQRLDGYINVSQLCNTHGKRLNNWTRSVSGNAYLQAVSEATRIRVGDLIEVKDGIPTYAHPDVAVEIARWVSPAFGIWCNRAVRSFFINQRPALPPDIEDKLEILTLFVSNENNTCSVSDQLRELEIGRTKGFRLLRTYGIMIKGKCVPYQKYIDRGYFKVRKKQITTGSFVQVTICTPEGQLWLAKYLKKKLTDDGNKIVPTLMESLGE